RCAIRLHLSIFWQPSSANGRYFPGFDDHSWGGSNVAMVVVMWSLFRACSLLLFVLLTTSAQAQSQRSLGTLNTPEEIKARGADWLQQCLKDWDAATHMNKSEWSQTCHRVVDDRVKWLFDQAKMN